MNDVPGFLNRLGDAPTDHLEAPADGRRVREFHRPSGRGEVGHSETAVSAIVDERDFIVR